jgi:hypothetical protein
MICLVFVKISSPGNLYGAASTVWSLRISCILCKGGWSYSIGGPIMRFHVGVLEWIVIGHAYLMDANGYVICCAGA